MRPDYNLQAARRWLDAKYPTEIHSAGGDCINPKCDYEFTDADKTEIVDSSGWFICPQCDYSYNYLDEAYNTYDWQGRPTGGWTRAGITMDEMGGIGEEIVARLGAIEGVGQIIERHPTKQFPVDFTIGRYACEVKTNHSEAQPRFKLGGKAEVQEKAAWAAQNGLVPALVGVRLNFYTDKADVFFREGLTDTWIGNEKLRWITQVSFKDLNPFRSDEDVPPALYLPEDDETPARGYYDDIPF